MSAVCSGLISWSFLRHVPLWRTIVEPLLWLAGGLAAAVTLGSPIPLLALPPIGLALGVLSLTRRYPVRPQVAFGGPWAARLQSRTDAPGSGPEGRRS